MKILETEVGFVVAEESNLQIASSFKEERKIVPDLKESKKNARQELRVSSKK